MPPPCNPSLATVTCPRCTFHNHPSLLACEICGAPLLDSDTLRTGSLDDPNLRPDSPAPQLEKLSLDSIDGIDGVKLSFRAGGEKVFHERLKGAMIQRMWLSLNAPPIPKPYQEPKSQEPTLEQIINGNTVAKQSLRSVGIAGLESRGLQNRKANEAAIGSAFEDLEALMSSAKEIVELAQKFAVESGRSTEASAVLSESAAALGMVATKDMLKGGSDSLYISELSRNLAEFLTDDRRGILKSEGGIMSLVDLWAVFNRSRNGVELVSPADFEKGAQLWETLHLPVRLKAFKSGLLVAQRNDFSDDKIIQQLRRWIDELNLLASIDDPSATGSSAFGQPVTAQQAARRFSWSLGVATEELEMAEDKGLLCREESIEGLKFWINQFSNMDDA